MCKNEFGFYIFRQNMIVMNDVRRTRPLDEAHVVYCQIHWQTKELQEKLRERQLKKYLKMSKIYRTWVRRCEDL